MLTLISCLKIPRSPPPPRSRKEKKRCFTQKISLHFWTIHFQQNKKGVLYYVTPSPLTLVSYFLKKKYGLLLLLPHHLLFMTDIKNNWGRGRHIYYLKTVNVFLLEHLSYDLSYFFIFLNLRNLNLRIASHCFSSLLVCNHL